eukprot:902932-Pyramimonas_sp.AAC.1
MRAKRAAKKLTEEQEQDNRYPGLLGEDSAYTRATGELVGTLLAHRRVEEEEKWQAEIDVSKGTQIVPSERAHASWADSILEPGYGTGKYLINGAFVCSAMTSVIEVRRRVHQSQAA